MTSKNLVNHDTTPSVLLTSMPWTNLNQPSLGLGILKAILNQANIPTTIKHLNLEMLQFIKGPTYFGLANNYALNDFLFSAVIDPNVTHKQLRILRDISTKVFTSQYIDSCHVGSFERFIEKLLHLRNEQIPAWLDNTADEIANSQHSLIGFTCMFDQTIASLALSKLIKEKAPNKLIAFGGYAVRNPTAQTIMQSFPFVDAICLGEGEATITQLAKASTNKEALPTVPGLLLRVNEKEFIETPAGKQWDLDDIPMPDYDDFYTDLNALSDKHQVDVSVMSLPLENSRGCWWGQKKHCIFCGIKKQDLVYRFKKAEIALDHLHKMNKRYNETNFRFADYILPNDYYTSLMPLLAEEEAPYNLETEMKANVSPSKFENLVKAGFAGVQPGIESFSTPVLKLMDKGVHATQNVYLLRRGLEEGVKIQYNIIYGFPNETAADYTNMVKMMPRLTHMDPPITYVPAQITRYAPLHVAPELFGIPEATYHPNYELIFSRQFISKSGFELNDFCYFFERPFENPPHMQKIYRQMEKMVAQWVRTHQSMTAKLQWIDEANEGIILDSRQSTEKRHTLSGLETNILKAMEEPIAIAQLKHRFLKDCSESWWQEAIARLDDLGLFFADAGKAVALPVKKDAKLPVPIDIENTAEQIART